MGVILLRVKSKNFRPFMLVVVFRVVIFLVIEFRIWILLVLFYSLSRFFCVDVGEFVYIFAK